MTQATKRRIRPPTSQEAVKRALCAPSGKLAASAKTLLEIGCSFVFYDSDVLTVTHPCGYSHTAQGYGTPARNAMTVLRAFRERGLAPSRSRRRRLET